MNISMSSSNKGGAGFTSVQKTKNDEWKACLDRASVMKFGPLDKKSYAAVKCANVVNRFEYARMMDLNRKYRGMKDEIFDVV